jgi:hypothetical protein
VGHLLLDRVVRFLGRWLRERAEDVSWPALPTGSWQASCLWLERLTFLCRAVRGRERRCPFDDELARCIQGRRVVGSFACCWGSDVGPEWLTRIEDG